MENKTKYRHLCTTCGSEHLVFDAVVSWDVDLQQMVLEGTEDGGFCHNCCDDTKSDPVEDDTIEQHHLISVRVTSSTTRHTLQAELDEQLRHLGGHFERNRMTQLQRQLKTMLMQTHGTNGVRAVDLSWMTNKDCLAIMDVLRATDQKLIQLKRQVREPWRGH
jgi:hypothetical protein